MRRVFVYPLSLALILGTVPVGGLAGPKGSRIEGGQATITHPNGTTTIINQKSHRAIGGFTSFNVNKGERVVIRQPGTNAIFWTKDYQNGPSQIHGRIIANGQYWHSNPFGILVGKTGHIDTAGTLLTTARMRNENFLKGNYIFDIPGRPDASIINEGLLTVKDMGIAGIAAPGVVNDGVIMARLSKVHLASANTFTLDTRGDGLFRLAVDDAIVSQVIDHRTGKPLKSLVQNNGLISVPGGLVALTAVEARIALDSVIDSSGQILAPAVEKQIGKVYFSTALPSQQLKQINARRQAQRKQLVRQKVKISGRIDVSGKAVNQTGGEILVLGEVLGLEKATLDASGHSGGGLVFVGGEYLGGKATSVQQAQYSIRSSSLKPTQNARYTTLNNTTINVDALVSGRGGQSIVWADHNTIATGGSISARGGKYRGNGGFSEVSGKQYLFAGIPINVSAVNGKNGTALFDPGDAVIADVGATPELSTPFAVPSTSTILASAVETVLNTGGDVTITTDNGRIDVNADIQKTSGDESTLRLESTNGFMLTAGKKIERVAIGTFDTDKHDLNVIINGNTDLDRTGTTEIAGSIITLGGDVDIRGQRITLHLGAVQTLNDPEGNDGSVFIKARVQDGPTDWAVISLGPQAINAGNGTVTIEASGLASDDTISFSGERAVSTLGKVTITADKIEANPGRTPHIYIGASSPDPTITGTQLQPVVISKTNPYTPQTPPVGPVDDPPTVGSGTFLNHTTGTADSFSYTTSATGFADDGGPANLSLTATGFPVGITFSDNGNGVGTFTGSPSSTGTFTVTVTARDASGNTVSRTFQIVVQAGSVTPGGGGTSTSPTATAAGIIESINSGQAFTFTIPASTFSDDGGVNNLSLMASNVPSGVSFVDNGDGTGTFAGTYNDVANFRPTITARDADGQSVSKNIRFEVTSCSACGGVSVGGSSSLGTSGDSFGPGGSSEPSAAQENPPRASGLGTFTHTASVFGDVSLAVSRAYFSDDGGRSNLTLSLADGFVAPAGTRMSISRDGTLVVAGTLRRQGTYFVPVTATDQNGLSVTRTFRMVFDANGFVSLSTQTSQNQQQETAANNSPPPPRVEPRVRPNPQTIDPIIDPNPPEAVVLVAPQKPAQTHNPRRPRSLSQHPSFIRRAILESGLIQVTVRDPEFNDFSAWKRRYGADAAAEFLFAFKMKVEGKSSTVAFGEMLALRDSWKVTAEVYAQDGPKAFFRGAYEATPVASGVAVVTAAANGEIVGVLVAGSEFVPAGKIFKHARGPEVIAALRKKFGKKVDDIENPGSVKSAGPGGAPNRVPAASSNYQPTHLASAGDALDTRLPVRVTGQPTNGVIDAGGTAVHLKSGAQGPANRWYDPNKPAINQTATHVEGHATALMVDNKITNMTVTINNRTGPCNVCKGQIPDLLPQGSTLNVRWQDAAGNVHVTPIHGRATPGQ